MEFNFKTISPQQDAALAATQYYQCLSGGYGSGKTYIASIKLMMLALTFAGYRVAIIRKELNVLKKTTLRTLLKVLPPDVIETMNMSEGTIKLKNGSEFMLLGLDRFSEQDVKSLEINAAFIDQAEELDEGIFTHLDTRIGRWDEVTVPDHLLKSDPNWPRNPNTNRPLAPTYLILACNPDTEFHWIYREFHPQSKHWQRFNKDTHFFINMPSTSNTALLPEVLARMLKKDPEFKRRYVNGEWGFSEAQIHKIPEECILDVSHAWFEDFKKKALLYRTYDHGESSPSSCIWGACFRGIHVIYREYYMPGKLISYHRQCIHAMSGNEKYTGNYADPEIFRKRSQKDGARYCTADEYKDTNLTTAPPIYWLPADNDEMGTRNRINELFEKDDQTKHPLTGIQGAPRIYFLQKNEWNHDGCDIVLNEIQAQRREKLGEINGRTIWSQDRDKNVPDHSYDAFRYYVAIHSSHNDKIIQQIPQRSFEGIRKKTTGDLSYGIRTF